MRHPPRLEVTLALTIALAASGCGEVIGLGPEPSREAVTVGGTCGLDAHPNPSCDKCAIEQCCDQSQGCFDDKTCLEESKCALDCAYDTTCIAGCGSRYGTDTYASLEGCLLGSCLMSCLPTGPCLKLIDCCQKVPAGNITHDACTSATNSSDEAGCQSLIDSGLLTPFCPELAP